LFDEYKIEYRPVVGGNLLRQPYLNYEIDSNVGVLNADIIHENGVYIGNSQFVSNKEMELLKTILEKL
jgi:CDP-6-deoxy-D-xylo-4-hexulose-3-dehydrase